MKIGPVDTEMALLIVKNKEKNEEINASKIYSPSSGKFAEWAKLQKVIYIAQSATYLSGLKSN